MTILSTWLPDFIYLEGRFLSDHAITCDSEGKVVRIAASDEVQGAVRLKRRALLPGLVNAHSHAFQRVIRGRTEHRSQNTTDTFWTWREQMYAAANRLEVEDIYAASRMAFLEMALTGITAVGEFHYIHHAPDGSTYSDPNLLAREVIRAARDVGIRIALLRVAYARAGYEVEPNPQQVRFIEESPDIYLKHFEQLLDAQELNDGMAWAGVAPHSVRAVPLDYLKTIAGFANERELPVHMHVAEQPAEVSACIEEYGRSPVALLDTEGLLSRRFTAVHAIHVTPKAIGAIAGAGAMVCACPTTERNLGDGVVPVDAYFKAGVPVSLGTDSQIQIDLLEDARELEYHLRLQKTARNVLAPDDDESSSALARRLFECATVNGAKSIGFNKGQLEPGAPADFFTVDLDDPSIAGSAPDDLLANIVFSLSRTAVRDVVVGGRTIVEDGRHLEQDAIIKEFKNSLRPLRNSESSAFKVILNAEGAEIHRGPQRKQTMSIKDTLAELVRIDSVSSRSNAEIIGYLERRCQAMHLVTRRFPYKDDYGVEKFNLIALAGTDFSDNTEVELALVGHSDTVPYDPNWIDATNLTERDGKLYGRGSCDTKGFIAAALTAVETIDLSRLNKPLALIFTADEEIGLRGAKRLADEKPLRARYSIVGEPTSLKPIRAGKGYSLAEVIVKGREAHSAYPALGASAVFRAARLINRLEAVAAQIQEDQHNAFDPPYTTLNIGLIHGGSAKNVLAGECRFTLEWRPIPTQSSGYLLNLFRTAIQEEKQTDPGFECEVDASRADSGFETSPDSPLIKLMEKLTGIESGTVAFGTEAAQMMALGAEAVVIGPGDIREAHRTGEFVPVAELERCVEILKEAVMLCGATADT